MRKERIRTGLLWLLIGAVCLSVLAIFLLGRADSWITVLRTPPVYLEWEDLSVETRQIEGYAGVEKRYTAALPDTSPWGEYIFIYLVHQYAEVYIDDTLVARSAEPESRHLGHTPGCYWFTVPIVEADTGRRLTIVTRPIYAAVAGRDPRVILAAWNQALEALVKESLGELIMSVVCVAAGLLLVAMGAMLSMERREKRQMLYLGAFTLSVGLWRLCDLQGAALLFPRLSYPIYILSILGLMLTPLLFTRFLYWQRGEEGRTPYRLLSLFFLAETMVLLGLQLLDLFDLRSAVNILFAGIFLAGIPIFIQSLLNLVRSRGRGMAALYDSLYIAFVLASLFDVYRFYRRGSSRFLTAFICVTALHLLIMCVVIFRQTMERRQRAYQLEVELAEERARLMLSQIQPHFLYNSLGVIRELCHSDPVKAEDATVKFSQYLRQNMDALLMENLISFSDELQHTRNYLELEQLRFGDRLRVEYDIAARGFRLPALTLQPTVENAVRHGTRQREGGGTVIIRSWEEPDGYQILVEDNGPGFDPARLPEDGKSHVGLRNVRNRLEHLCGGGLTVESVIGAGTRVRIHIPKR